MKSSFVSLTLALLFTTFIAAPVRVHGQQAAQPGHDHDHAAGGAAATPDATKAHGQMEMMARMKAADQKLDELVKKMNEAKGTEKTDAIAALLTALVREHQQMHESMMGDMSGMMDKHMGERGSSGMKPQPKP